MTHVVDPFVMVLLDGREHHFYYNAAAAKKATKALRREELEVSGVDVLIGMFYWSDEDRGEMTLEEYCEIMPGDMEALAKKFSEMKEAHGFQRPPRVAAPSPETATG